MSGILVIEIEGVGEVGADKARVFDGGPPRFAHRGEFDQGFDGSSDEDIGYDFFRDRFDPIYDQISEGQTKLRRGCRAQNRLTFIAILPPHRERVFCRRRRSETERAPLP